MTPAALARRVAYAAQFRLDKLVAEPMNRALERRYRAAPAHWLERIDAGVGRGLAWFAPQPDLTMSALHVLDQARRLTADPRFGFLDAAIARYRATIHDPALRLVDPSYDPAAHRHLPDIMQVRPYLPIELLMIEAAWADQNDPEVVLDRLRTCADGGFYGSTHILVGGLAMKRAGARDPERIDAVMQGEVPAIAGANRRNSYAGDLFAERIVVLQWLGRHDLVSPAWLLRLLRAQRPDGGWRARNIQPYGRSNQHTSCLAIGALAQFAHHERTGDREAAWQGSGKGHIA